MELRNKVVLVAGGGSGVGLGIAQALAAEGCRVAICGRREETLRRAVAMCRQGLEVRWNACDISDRRAVGKLMAWMERELDLPDILVNSAGINVPQRMMANVSPEDFDRVLAVNATGAFNLFRAVLPGMRVRGEGLIVNIVSIAGRRALTLAGVPYCASKSAQGALGTFLNLEESANGIRVTNIYPGEVNTPLIDRRAEPPPPEQRARMLQPEDVAACVVTIARLPARALVTDLVIVPPYQADVL